MRRSRGARPTTRSRSPPRSRSSESRSPTRSACWPAAALVGGLERPLPAAIGLVAVAAGAAIVALAAPDGRVRAALEAGAAAIVLYLASVLLVTPFQPGSETAALPLAELDVRQQGQALLSALWAWPA